MKDYDLSAVAPAKKKETMRRIRSLDRHLDDPLAPPAADLAAKLGMSTNSFHLLARIWRAGKRPEALADHGAAQAARPAGSAPTDPDDPEFALVAPGRRDETIRRIRVLDRYIHGSDAASAAVHAADLGVDIDVFYRMARIWKATGRPEALPNSGAPRSRRDSFTPEQSVLVAQAVAEAGHVGQAAIQKRAIALAREEGVVLPTTAALIKKIRSMTGGRLDPRSWARGCDLVLDHFVIGQGFLHRDDTGGSGQPMMPVATVLFDVAAAAPIAVCLAEDGPSACAVARTLSVAASRELRRREQGRGIDGAKPTLAITTFPGPEWASLAEAVERAGLILTERRLKVVGKPTAAVDLLGLTHAGIRLKPLMITKPFADRTASGRSGLPPMRLPELEDLVRSRWVAPALAEGPMATLGLEKLDRLRRLKDSDLG